MRLNKTPHPQKTSSSRDFYGMENFKSIQAKLKAKVGLACPIQDKLLLFFKK
jgi:uracil DNA glycosylase